MSVAVLPLVHTHRFLVAVIDKLMPPFYYSHGLAAAQADQVRGVAYGCGLEHDE